MLLRYVKVLWICVSAIVLTITIHKYDGTPNSDVDIFMIWAMLALSFPLSLACALAISSANYIITITTGSAIATSYLTIIIYWLAFFVVGYWQWYILAPKIYRLTRRKNGPRDNPGTKQKFADIEETTITETPLTTRLALDGLRRHCRNSLATERLILLNQQHYSLAHLFMVIQ